MRDNESHIIDEILNGRTFRYEYFVETYSRQVFATIVRIIDKPEDAEELTQDVFMKAFENLSSFNGKSTFATWLYRIAYNTAISAARRSVPVESLIDDRQLTLISDNAVDEALDDDSEEQIEKLNDAIARLSADERALVNMFYMEEQSVSDIAYITGLSVPNAKTKLHRVRKKLYLLMTETKKLCIIRKTKCSYFPKRNVLPPKTKRTFFSPLISDRHNPFQGCGGSIFMRL